MNGIAVCASGQHNPDAINLFITRCDPREVAILTTDKDKAVLAACERVGHEPMLFTPNIRKYGKKNARRVAEKEMLLVADSLALFWDGIATRGEHLLLKCIKYSVDFAVFDQFGKLAKHTEWR